MLDRPAHAAGTASLAEHDKHRHRDGVHHTSDGVGLLIAALRQRRQLFAAVVLAIPLCCWLTLKQMTPQYTATGSLIYEPSEYKLRELQSILHADPTNDAMMATQVELLQSQRIAQKVAERGHLFEDPGFNAALRPPSALARLLQAIRDFVGAEPEPAPDEANVHGVARSDARDATLVAVRAALHAVQANTSHVVDVSFTAPDPRVAATAVNNAMDAYIKDQFAAKHRAVDNATRLLREQSDKLRQDVRRIEERMASYRAEHRLSQGVHAATDTEEITHLTEDLSRARTERATADAKLDAARGHAGAQAQAAVAPSVVQMRSQLDRLSAAIQAQAARLGSAHPEAQGLRREYEEAQRALTAEISRVVAAIEAEQRAAADRVTTLEAMLRDTEAAAEQVSRAQIPLNAMQRDLDAARAQLQAVLERIEQTAQQTSVETSEAHEISYAMPPARPSAPRVVQSMAASMAAAVFLGLLLVYLLHLADPTVANSDALRLVTELPCMALVPEVRARDLRRVALPDLVVQRPHTRFAEQVRWLRAALSRHVGQSQVIALTAAAHDEGVSLLALALGRSAQMSHARILLIDCAVRHAAIGPCLGLGAAPGLMEVLRGETDWRSAIQTDPLTGLDVLVAGNARGDVLGMFDSEPMRQLLEETREHYALVLLDVPPVETCAESHIVAGLADATVLCVRWRRTRMQTVTHALTVLRDARATVIGTALTRVDPATHLRSGSADAAVYCRIHSAHFRR